MRIAHVTATFPPYYGGTGTVCYNSALQLARLGHEVIVFTAKCPNGKCVDSDEFAVRRLPAPFRIGNAPCLPGLLGLKGFDIIHLHHPFIFGAEMIWAVSKLRRIPYVITHHNDLIGVGLRRPLFNLYSALSTRLVFRGACRFAAVSVDHAADCRLTPLFRKRWDDVVEIPNGVDTEHFRPGLNGTAVRRRQGISRDARVILFVGALDRAHHYRRVDLLFEAVRLLADPHLHLLIVGDGDLATHYRNFARELRVDRQTHFVGSVDHQSLPGFYTAADVVVLPSQLQESFGLVLIEAMACGKPVVTSNLPGVRSVVRDGQDGLLVSPGNADELAAKLRLLLDDAPQRQEMGVRGRARVEERYAWPVIIRRLERLYEGVLVEQVDSTLLQ
jgi:glycosyltransferase involved in cell wall biosynthesis